MHALLLISCLAALLACSSVQAAERQPATTFSGHTVGVLTEQSSQPSSYGYEKKERKLCLSESQLSNCGVGSIPGGFASFQYVWWRLKLAVGEEGEVISTQGHSTTHHQNHFLMPAPCCVLPPLCANTPVPLLPTVNHQLPNSKIFTLQDRF